MAETFWRQLEQLIATSRRVIDRPAGTAHPRYPDFIYPLDYGYLEGTTAADGGGIDIWVGSLSERCLVGVICCVDTVKRDTELKLLLGCTAEEVQTILAVHNSGLQAALWVPRPK